MCYNINKEKIMICDKCHLVPASVVVNHVINGHSSVFHFCERCAQEQGLLADGRIMFKLPMSHFGLVIPSNFYRRAQKSFGDDNLGVQFEELVAAPLRQKENEGETYLEQTISELKRERDKAVKNEDYSSAAMLRDRIKELKSGLD